MLKADRYIHKGVQAYTVSSRHEVQSLSFRSIFLRHTEFTQNWGAGKKP